MSLKPSTFWHIANALTGGFMGIFVAICGFNFLTPQFWIGMAILSANTITAMFMERTS